MLRILLFGLVIVILVGCSGNSEPEQIQTGKALSISDSAAARAARLDSLSR